MKKARNDIIAIIDSGIGGISILRQLIRKHKTGKYIYFADNLYMPYGTKDRLFVKQRVEEIIDFLKNEYHVNKIIIACNTASSCLYGTKDKCLELLTFNKENKYLTTELTQKNLKGYDVIASKDLATDIERNIFKENKLNKIIKKQIEILNLDKEQEIILGCTHYELVADIFKKHCKHTEFRLNSSSLIDNIKVENTHEVKVTIIMSNKTKEYENKLIRLLNI